MYIRVKIKIILKKNTDICDYSSFSWWNRKKGNFRILRKRRIVISYSCALRKWFVLIYIIMHSSERSWRRPMMAHFQFFWKTNFERVLKSIVYFIHANNVLNICINIFSKIVCGTRKSKQRANLIQDVESVNI